MQLSNVWFFTTTTTTTATAAAAAGGGGGGGSERVGSSGDISEMHSGGVKLRSQLGHQLHSAGFYILSSVAPGCSGIVRYRSQPLLCTLFPVSYCT